MPVEDWIASFDNDGTLRAEQPVIEGLFAIARAQLLINHDDGEREFAYQEADDGSLKAARENGWTIVSMKNDRKQIFSTGRR